MLIDKIISGRKKPPLPWPLPPENEISQSFNKRLFSRVTGEVLKIALNSNFVKKKEKAFDDPWSRFYWSQTTRSLLTCAG